MHRLFFTVDYEVFGNGSGCPEACLLKPTERFVNLLEKFNCRATFFVDALEFLAFKNCTEKSPFPYAELAAKIELQIQDLVKRGHDVQLHLHPQWIGAKLNGSGCWDLNYEYWRLPKVGGGFKYENKQGVDAVIALGKEYLETLIKPIKSDYVCRAFRAGSWCIQPEEQVITALKSNGINIDTTVAPGMECDNNLTKYNFTAAPNQLALWEVDDCLCTPCQTGDFREIPIHTARVSKIRRAYWRLQKKIFRIKSLPAGCKGQAASTTVKTAKVKSRLSNNLKMFDFCNASASELKFMMKNAKKVKSQVKGDSTPVITIGHSKNFANEQQLEVFLSWLTHQKDMDFDKLGGESLWSKP